METQLKIRIPQVIVDLDAPLENHNNSTSTPPPPPLVLFLDVFLRSFYTNNYSDKTTSTTPPPPPPNSSSDSNKNVSVLDVHSMRYYHNINLENGNIRNKSVLYYFGNTCILIICIPVCIVLLPFLILSYIGA
jgi:hypothetical protein